ELTFELDGQSVAEPKHWRDDDPSSGLRGWLVRPAAALREMSWALSKNEIPDAEITARWEGLAWLLTKVTAQQTNLPVIDAPTEATSAASFASVQQQSDLLAHRAADYQFSSEFARQLLET